MFLCASEGFACNMALTAYVAPSGADGEAARGLSIKKREVVGEAIAVQQREPKAGSRRPLRSRN